MSALIENGRVESTTLGVEHHGHLTAELHLKFDGSAQSYGGWSFDDSAGFCAASIRGLLEALRVERWEDIRGAYVRVRRAEPYGRIVAIGHILEERWFSFDDTAARFR